MVFDTISVLRAAGKKLAKHHRWLGDSWASDNIEHAYRFDVTEIRLSSLFDIYNLLKRLKNCPERAIIRGQLTDEARRRVASNETVRRLSKDQPDCPATFQERDHYWVAFDIDTVSAAHLDVVERPIDAIKYAVETALPPCFHEVSVVFQWTGSAAIKDRITTKCRLWFWLDQPLSSIALKKWMRNHAGGKPMVDEALFNTVQLTYTAAPVLTGAPDPIGERLGLIRRASDVVTVPVADVMAPARQTVSATTRVQGTASAASASEKVLNGGGGLRAFSVEEALSWLGDGDGLHGFHQPLLAAGMTWARSVDPQMADRQLGHLKTTMRAAITAAPKAPARDVSRYLSDGYLDESIKGALRQAQNERLRGVHRNPLPGRNISVGEAERLIRAEVELFFDRASAAAAHRNDTRKAVCSSSVHLGAWADDPDWKDMVEADGVGPSDGVPTYNDVPVPHMAIAAMVGLGKTQAVLDALAARPQTVRDYRIHFYAPDNRLVGEILQRAQMILPGDVSVRVRRGRTDVQLGEPLCRPEMHARAAMIEEVGGSVSKHLCPRCPFAGECTWRESVMERGLGLRIMPHAYLTDASASAADIAIIDESAVLSLARHVQTPIRRFEPITLPEVPATKQSKDGEVTKDLDDLQEERKALFAARLALWTAMDEGSRVPLLSELRANGLTIGLIREAKRLENERSNAFDLELDRLMARGATDQEIRNALVVHNIRYGDAAAMAAVWRSLEKQWPLQRNQLNGWSLFQRDGQVWLDVGYRATMKGATKPTLVLDATASEELLRLALPDVSSVLHVRAHQPHARITQVSDTLLSMNQMSPRNGDSIEDAKRKANNVDKVIRIATAIGRGVPAGLITYKAVEEATIEGSRQAGRSIENLRLGHFGAVRGRNVWAGDPALVIAGRPRPDALDLTRLTSALFFDQEAAVELGEQYLWGASVHHLTSGRMVSTDRAEVHPNSVCELVRRQVTEAELCQAIGRARGVRRTEKNPVQILVLTSVPLPIEVDRLAPLSDLQPSTVELIAGREGVFLAAPRHAHRAFPGDWPSVHAAEKEYGRMGQEVGGIARGAGHSLYTVLYKEMSGTSSFTPYVYKLAGAGQRYERAWFDLTRIPDPARWLEDRLGREVKARAARIIQASVHGSAHSAAMIDAQVVRSAA